jgi:coenzyme Q-binding protein COQ10
MPTVDVVERVPAPLPRVYDVLQAMERFPEFMVNVESVTVMERGDGYTVTRWVARLKGSRFEWTERDTFYPDQGRIEFEQVAGDLKVFRGFWQLTAHGETETEVVLSTTFEFGLPMVAALLNPLARIALRDNARAMLTAVAAELRGSSRDG